ncbi:MAG: hypothetical protein JNL69_05625 [Bacteroidia bacterium]|nr:hypothetical protein [Bacteroidia bacterium]
MKIITDVFIYICLISIVYQDLKYRAVHWFIFPALFLTFGIKSLQTLTFEELAQHTFFNLGFVLVQLILLSVYMSIKHKKITNIINTQLGLGDILLWICLSIAFSPTNFILFFISGLCFSLIVYLIFRFLKKDSSEEIPLAGLQSLFLTIILLYNHFFSPLNLYSSTAIDFLL